MWPRRKGDHRPAKELLLHTKVIEPVAKEESSGISVHIGGYAADVKILLSSGSVATLPSKMTR